MDREHLFIRDEVYPSWFVNALGAYLSLGAFGFAITKQNDTTIQVTAGANTLAATIAVQGRWRWIEATITRAHPGGGAGTYDIYVTATDNDIQPTPDPYTDDTNRAFALAIVASGATPPIVAGSVEIFRKVGSLLWDGSKISRIDQTVPLSPLHASRHMTGGVDPIAPADIGAATETDLTAEVARAENAEATEIGARQAADSAEASARASADSSEASARAAADTTLTNNLNTEIANRTAGDSAEASARTSADNTEATARANADSAEASARASADSAEATSRQNADRFRVVHVANLDSESSPSQSAGAIIGVVPVSMLGGGEGWTLVGVITRASVAATGAASQYKVQTDHGSGTGALADVHGLTGITPATGRAARQLATDSGNNPAPQTLSDLDTVALVLTTPGTTKGPAVAFEFERTHS